ncbi:MAG: helix-hairpin-helix domain-containing protein [Patescibacteria group bacterium]
MSNFLKSFSPLLKRLKLKKYIFEIILLFVAIIITIISLIIYTSNNQINEKQDQTLKASLSPKIINENIFIDASGAVKKPNLYQVNYGARIKEVIDKAGGLSDDADVIFFNRNFNLARIVTDQEKIYVPSIAEINNGIFIQNQLTLDYVLPSTSNISIAPTTDTQTDNQLISLNSATIEELDQLPGIGQVTANKIITNRPYSTLEELLTKKVVNKNVFEKIKTLISL